MQIVVTNPGTERAEWHLKSEVLVIDVPDTADPEGISMTAKMRPIDMREMGQVAGLGTFDTALPHSWCVRVQEVTGKWPFGMVWSYPSGNIFGYPVPLTKEAFITLWEYETIENRRIAASKK